MTVLSGGFDAVQNTRAYGYRHTQMCLGSEQRQGSCWAKVVKADRKEDGLWEAAGRRMKRQEHLVIWDEPESVKGRVRVHKVRGGCFTRSLECQAHPHQRMNLKTSSRNAL